MVVSLDKSAVHQTTLQEASTFTVAVARIHPRRKVKCSVSVRHKREAEVCGLQPPCSTRCHENFLFGYVLREASNQEGVRVYLQVSSSASARIGRDETSTNRTLTLQVCSSSYVRLPGGTVIQ